MATKFPDEEMKEFRNVFESFDKDNSGQIDAKEMTEALVALKEKADPATVSALIAELDTDGSQTIDFSEFLAVIASLRSGSTGKAKNFAKVYEKQKEMIKVKGAAGTHSYAQEEMSAFAEHFNNVLKDDPDLGYLLPISPKGIDLALKIADGVLLAKFINKCVADTIDERALNKRKDGKPITVFKCNENLNLVISAAKSIGVQTVNLGSTELSKGGEFPHLVLGLIWQLVKIQLLNSISLKNIPELVRLLNEGETLADLMKLPPDQLLLRWFNFHLKNAGHDKRITNLSSDVKDGIAYTVLLAQLAPSTCDKSALSDPDVLTRASKVLANAARIDVPIFIQASDIASGNARLNLAFTAAIFNTRHGLEELTEAEKAEFAGMMEDDVGDSREERAFRMWMNTLGIPDFYVNSLWEDCKDGLVLLKVIDHIEPGIVDWKKKVELNPDNKFKKLSNCNYAVDLGKQMKFSLVGIGGVDIHDGKKKLLLAFVWQLMRYHTIKFLSRLSMFGHQVKDEQIIEWANKKVKDAGRPSEMKSFKDKTLATSHFFFDLLYTLNGDIINWDLVTDGDSGENKLLNAKYAISVARKLNCTIFLLPEDIVEVKEKMILTFVAAMMTVALQSS